jgi:photosystem II stability/assembly factor-like uncharacterized protein
VVVYNDGTVPLIFDTLYFGNRGQSSNRDFTIHSECEMIQPGESCLVSITYHPTSYGAVENDGVVVFQGDCEFANFHVSANVVHNPYQNNSWTPIGLEGRSITNIGVGKNALFASTIDSGNVYCSEDGGITWSKVLSVGGWQYLQKECLAVSPSGVVFYSNFTGQPGMYRSPNKGVSWEIINPINQIMGCTLIPPATVFLLGSCRPSELARSTNNGLTWDIQNEIGGQLIATYKNEYIITFGQCNAWLGCPPCFYFISAISTDVGETWNVSSTVPFPSVPRAIAFDVNKNLYAGCYDGLYQSADLCTTWTKVSEIIPNNILPISDQIIFISTEGQGIFISIDVGNTWLSFNTGLTNLNVHTLAMDSLGYVYAGTDSGIFRTSLIDSLLAPSIVQHLNGGWNLLSLPIHPFNHCPSENYPGATSSAFIYSGSYYECNDLCVAKGYWLKLESNTDFQLWGHHTELETVDVSLGWNIIGSLSDPFLVSTITSEPAGIVTSSFMEYDGVKYNASDTIRPGKGYWVKVNQAGKLMLSATGKAIASNRIKIVASDEQPPPPPNSEIPNPKSEIPKQFSLGQNYPNPFNPRTDIRFTISAEKADRQDARFTSLKIYDVLGREVATLVNEVKQPGEYTATWDAANVPSGIYFYRLTAGRYVETKKLILMK